MYLRLDEIVGAIRGQSGLYLRLDEIVGMQPARP
jgi:proteasome assembly chaperone (PAC2) family protein